MHSLKKLAYVELTVNVVMSSNQAFIIDHYCPNLKKFHFVATDLQ